MRLRLITPAILLAAIAFSAAAGCRSAKPSLPPPDVLASYAPRSSSLAVADDAMQANDLAISAPSAASGKSANGWRPDSTSRGSSCTSGCCSQR